jgi:uncharacterized membrane protein YqjE
MIHPLIRLLATQPQLVAEHMGAYAALLGSEVRQVKDRLLLRILLTGLALVLVMVAATLVGVSLMLWFTLPDLDTGARWALVLVPAMPVIGAVASMLVARRPITDESFQAVQVQLEADARMLSEAGAA